jgi:hypothetical protein
MKNNMVIYVVLCVPVLIFIMGSTYFYSSYLELVENRHPQLEKELFASIKSTDSMEGLKSSCAVILSQGIINYSKAIKVHKSMIYVSLIMVIYFSLSAFIIIRKIKRVSPVQIN